MIQNQPSSTQLQIARAAFEQQFGRSPAVAAIAPGRVNLIGEHIDYNDGWVLPMAISQSAVAVGQANDSKRWVLRSLQQEPIAEFDFRPWLQSPPSTQDLEAIPSWARYPIGVLAELIGQGWDVPGFDALFTSTVPLGGGLSSSAAIEVATATLVEMLTGRSLDPTEKALLCQRAEHRFAGVPCGMMDQFSSVFGQANHFMLIDCLNLSVTQVPFDQPTYSILIINSNVSHSLGDSEYAARRDQCQAALMRLEKSSWRQVDVNDLSRLADDDLLFRRARHVVSEIKRTREVGELMIAGEIKEVGTRMYASHESLRVDYQVSCSEVDCLVEIAREIGGSGGVWGSRITGGGFGGCTVSLVETERLEQVMATMGSEYVQRTGIESTMFSSRPNQGAAGLSLD